MISISKFGVFNAISFTHNRRGDLLKTNLFKKLTKENWHYDVTGNKYELRFRKYQIRSQWVDRGNVFVQ